MKIIAFLKAVWAVFLSLFLSLSPAGFPQVPHEKDFELVWSDEFDGDALDQTKWAGHFCGGEDARRTSLGEGGKGDRSGQRRLKEREWSDFVFGLRGFGPFLLFSVFKCF